MAEENVSGELVGQQLPETPANEGVETPASGGEAANLAGQAAASEYVKVTDAVKMIQDEVGRVLRQSQSMTDKASARLSQQINELKSTIDEIRTSGSQVPAETLAAIGALSSALGEPAAADNGGNNNAAGAGEPGVDVDVAAAKIFQDNGLALYEKDPEAGLVDYSSKEKFLETLEQAIKAKAKRVGQNETEEAHVPLYGGGGQTNQISDVRDPKELYAIALGVRRR